MSDQQDGKPMEFTGPERRFLEAMWAGFKTIPELDMTKVGAQMDMNPRSCANLWGQIKKKIMHNAACPAGPVGNSPATPAKRKRGKKDDEGSPAAKAPKTPKTPKTPGGRGKRAAKKESVDGEDNNQVSQDEDVDAEDSQAGEI
ncbi:hypothetical protein QBC37DRAFT_372364 [Rhypophila decipiens]|uniref:Myb-like domain-containing protein n=1 Tax=Rhypophila decipiens TaxID=261697 RepID=A0AAN6YBY2_9PEZI|nr:hypothetical protein QBC37DRAFT_372364 [Rhypophila decipiens]